jgi:tetratricopeptide (TPR) repeat protein
MMALAAMAAANLWAVQGTLTTDTETLAGDIKWQPRSKKYIVSVKKGSTMVDMERPLADVKSLDIPKPAGFDKAVEQVEGGNGAAAVALLSKVVADYRMLKWDKPAGRYLALAYLSANQAQKAYDACMRIIQEDKTAAYSGDLAAAFWQSLLKLGKNEQLEGLVNKAISSGDRRASAAALVMRGDIVVAGCNDAPDGLRKALTDGYLRVALMYGDAECVRERSEALLKAATCFDKLGQAARAEKLRAQAKSL